MSHERTAVAGDHGSTVLTDILVFESRGRRGNALMRAAITATFRRRHRRLRHHFEKVTAEAR